MKSLGSRSTKQFPSMAFASQAEASLDLIVGAVTAPLSFVVIAQQRIGNCGDLGVSCRSCIKTAAKAALKCVGSPGT